MIKSLMYDASEKRLVSGGAELIDVWSGSPSNTIWLILGGADDARDREILTQRFGVPPLAIADALRDRHPPKFERFADNTFILLKGLDADTKDLDYGTIQLSMFVGDRFLVTRSTKRSVSTERVSEALVAGEIPPDTTPSSLALHLCRAVADRFVPVLMTVEARLEEMETEMIERPSDELLAELIRQKGSLKQILRVVQYHSQIFTAAVGSIPKQLGDHMHELTDVQEQLDRQLSLTRLYYDLTDDLMNGYLSLSAHRLNQIMQTLTIVTVIFVPITFMAGIYGMNFEYIPELGFRYAYFILMAAMLAVVVGVLLVLRAKGWLGSRAKRRA
jgi:magnesium transporter